MVAIQEDMELILSRKQNQIYMHRKNYYSTETNEGWIYSFWTASKRKRLRREGWELQEPSGSCENSLDLDWRSQWPPVFTPPATSIEQVKLYSSALAYPQEPPQCIPSYMAQSKAFSSEQREQIGTTGHQRTHLASWPGAAPTRQASAPGAVHRSHFIKPISVQWRETLYRKGWEPRELPGDWEFSSERGQWSPLFASSSTS